MRCRDPAHPGRAPHPRAHPRGELAPGDRIIETALAEEFEVSRHTLRSALQTLTHEGLLEQSQFKSTHVARPTARDVFETYTLRNTLEAMACRLAAERVAAGAGMAGVDAAVARMQAAGDTTAMKAADFDFHTAVVELAGHSRLSEHYRMLHGRTRLYLNLTATVGYEHDEITAKHAELAEAIRAGDATVAERLGATHNTADGERLVALLGQATGC